MTTYQEHQNLPVLPDLPGDLSIEQMEFFARVKELLEAMCGRRGSAPATPQFQVGEYTGNGALTIRVIEVNFRPRYIKIFIHPDDTTPVGGSNAERIIEYMDDPVQSINWDGNSYWHFDSAAYHEVILSTAGGIVGVTDDGFQVYAGSSGTSNPNIDETKYNWVAFG